MHCFCCAYFLFGLEIRLWFFFVVCKTWRSCFQNKINNEKNQQWLPPRWKALSMLDPATSQLQITSMTPRISALLHNCRMVAAVANFRALLVLVVAATPTMMMDITTRNNFCSVTAPTAAMLLLQTSEDGAQFATRLRT